MTRAGFGGQSFEAGEQLVVDEVQQAVAGQSFGVSGHVSPAEFFRDMGDRYFLTVISYSCSRSSKIFRKKSQVSCPSRYASPSTPASFRMMSWMDLMVAELRAIQSANFQWSMNQDFRSNEMPVRRK